MQETNTEEEFKDLVCSSEYDFLLNCGITKAPAVMKLSDKKSVISGICLHYGILESLGELEQFKRGLKTARFSSILEHSISRHLFIYHHEKITADFIQDLFEVQYSLPGSNKRFTEEAIVMNWLSYLNDLEGNNTCFCDLDPIFFAIV